ncbi:hypothetical protein BV25DRAFT_1795711 [Artomyces pyxidatus]|uniref:Uncharacterized protein n=1 Tax=Artomyces pyxidatus TaxID=48021 RepID=A0ACB8TEF9_9AGAM|nr:hypothetical protein BV25DRAFT_1795711 [Artomyces pyxidatus]
MSDAVEPRESPLKDPSGLFFEQPRTRRTIVTSYWIVVLLALPLWWSTTSIERLSLPVSRVHSTGLKQLHFPLQVEFDHNASSLSFEALEKETRARFSSLQRQSEGRLDYLDLRFVAIESTAGHPAATGAYGVSIEPSLDRATVRDRHLSVPVNEGATHIPFTLPDRLVSLLSPYTSRHPPGRFEHLVAKYAPRYRLAFTMLNEDAAGGRPVVGWDVQEAISRHLSPILDQVADLHNFTIESQVQFHSPLAFAPYEIKSDNEEIHGLTQEDLKVFVNSAEWTLSSSVSNDPVLHFILFIPSVPHTPLRILDNDHNPTSSNAFILPQWGGIVLLNLPPDTSSPPHLSEGDLAHTFSIFRTQLLKLLGVSDLPAGVEPADTHLPLTKWQLDTLYRQRAIENAHSSQETLQSIIKLVDQISNMPVGEGVRGDIQNALTALNMVYTVGWQSPIQALRHSSEALTHASRAFFNPGMLALLYFPAEHKYAVYTPLFAPVAVPLVVTALRELSAWRKSRRVATETKT